MIARRRRKRRKKKEKEPSVEDDEEKKKKKKSKETKEEKNPEEETSKNSYSNEEISKNTYNNEETTQAVLIKNEDPSNEGKSQVPNEEEKESAEGPKESVIASPTSRRSYTRRDIELTPEQKKKEQGAMRKIEQAEEELRFQKWTAAQTVVEDTKKGKNRRHSYTFLPKFLKKTDDSIITANEIGVPINIKHEGHIGFDKKEGGFQTQNLPPDYQQLFDNLNQTLSNMGVTGITESEGKILLKALIPHTLTETSSPKVTGKERGGEVKPVPPTVTKVAMKTTHAEEQLKSMIIEQDKIMKDLELRMKGEETKNNILRKDLKDLRAKTDSLTKENRIVTEEKRKFETKIQKYKGIIENYQTKPATDNFDKQVDTMEKKNGRSNTKESETI